MSVKAIFLDAGFTLLKPHPSIRKIYHRVCRKYGCTASEEEVGSALRDTWQNVLIPKMLQETDDLSTSDEQDRQWWWEHDREVFRRLNITDNSEECFREVYTIFEDPGAWSLFPETRDVLQKLKGADYCVAIVSNWNSKLPTVCRGLGIDRYLDFILTSTIAGLKKPAPGIFEQALSLAKVSPAETIHVGDMYQADVVGAEAVGIKAILIDRRGRNESDHDAVIRSLWELESYLE